MPKIDKPQPKIRQPLWRGPEVDGVTFSLLSRYLCCLERFRLLTIEGLKSKDNFNHKMEFGNMWHKCEEAFATRSNTDDPTEQWEYKLKQYTKKLCEKYKLDQDDVVMWYNICKLQFPIYCDFWAKHPDMKNRTPIVQEYPFTVPYQLPSGRTVILRGKWDSVDLVKSSNGKLSIILQENKTKGDVDERLIKKQLLFDLQTMLYLIALTQDTGCNEVEEVKNKYGVGKTPSAK